MKSAEIWKKSGRKSERENPGKNITIASGQEGRYDN
jgi:hypothetical protein